MVINKLLHAKLSYITQSAEAILKALKTTKQ